MSGARQSAITAAGLRKSFDETAVLDGVDFDVAPGTVFALLGPNGSGKTTTVNILATLLSPDGGEVFVAGYDVARQPDAVRAVIGLTGAHRPVLPPPRTPSGDYGAQMAGVALVAGSIRVGFCRRRGRRARERS
jgi:ABC-type transport system involved in cytochrome bd biosynthesis fused ATPase/permease subunit